MSAVGAIVVVVVVVVVVVGNRCKKYISIKSVILLTKTHQKIKHKQKQRNNWKNYCFATTTKRIKNVKLPLLPEQ